MTMIGSTDISPTKYYVRHLIRQRRRSFTVEQQAQFAQKAVTRVMAYPQLIVANTVGLFLSFDGELDTQPLIERLWHSGKHVFLPVLHPFSPGHLLFLSYRPTSKLVVNYLKIQEPRLDVRDIIPLQRLDILITPLVAFDANGQRLGMGGGFYDRTLLHWQQYSNPHPLGYAHDCQQVDILPVEQWDIPLPTVVTPSKVWSW